ncbi:protein GAMETE EXPRESSED 1 [Prosopis cineraria]|uniref:protein GAMETE EXPRESSED 1 n=1 Tax=Prosopis cineraria TaxID=364024 RepID=UPI00240F1950|nr:protein GAMETE EXPRESSED 1 [Prosopis cineraria]XP_054820075.1 protein GAMETE EXPRESSED 1 [Prosopis cineraria]
MVDNRRHLVIFLVLCFIVRCESWGSWLSSSSSETPSGPSGSHTVRDSIAEFSMEGFNDRKGTKLVENAKEKMVRSNWCWQNAYKNVFAGCSEILADEEKRSRLAWHLSDCFQRDSGRPHFPHCDAKSSMPNCLRALDDLAHKVYLEFYLETNTICHQLQAHAFKHETERLITDLKDSAHYVEDKLDNLYDKSENILQGYNKIHNSLESFDVCTQQMAENVVNVADRTGVLLKHSESMNEQYKEIADSQLQLQEVQEEMKMRLKDGIEVLNESYNNLGNEIGKLRDESIEIQKEIMKVGDTVSQEMQSLHSKAEDIVDLAGISLDKQQHLLEGQSKALHDLNSLSDFQSKALDESRKTFQQLAEFGLRHHEELLLRQQQIEGIHDRLMKNTKSILSAQESFELKQASVFAALDKIFALQNAMFLESRMIKAFFIYCASIVVIYMLTSTKQTYNTRPRLYVGLCAVFLVEIGIARFTSCSVEQQAWIIGMVRSAVMIAASVQLLTPFSLTEIMQC